MGMLASSHLSAHVSALSGSLTSLLGNFYICGVNPLQLTCFLQIELSKRTTA